MNLCESCVRWVDCGKKGNKEYGYCVLESLYTYTDRKSCVDYVKGEPMKEDDKGNIQEG